MWLAVFQAAISQIKKKMCVTRGTHRRLNADLGGSLPPMGKLRLTGMENPRGSLRALLQMVGADRIHKEAWLFSADRLAMESLLQGLCWGLCFDHTHLPEGWLFWPMIQALQWT